LQRDELSAVGEVTGPSVAIPAVVRIEFPLTVGVAGALLAPWLAGIGAIAALVTECSIVERQSEA
jgi:hypothetical protein